MVEAQTTVYQRCVDRLRSGDPTARDQLLELACDRLERLTRKMLRDYPAVRRWEQTADVLQQASLRLWRSLEEVELDSPRHFFHLAAVQIRRQLMDLARHYSGALGPGANQSAPGSELPEAEHRSTADTHNPSKLALWTEFHAQVARLPDNEREVFELVWYQQLTQQEVAEILEVSSRTVKRRWLAARLKLFDAMSGELPE